MSATTMVCGYCGCPVAAGVWIGSAMYHEECTRGPGWQPLYVQPLSLTAEDVRRIVREELARLKDHP